MESYADQVVEYIPHLRALARTLTAGDRSLADDLVQETLLKALRAESQFAPGTNLKAWLSVILRNHFLTVVRAKRNKMERSSEGLDLLVKIAPPQESRLEFEAFQAAFAKLSPHQREVLVLVCLDGCSYEQAAEQCGVEVGTIKSRVSRARNTLKAILLGDEGEGAAEGVDRTRPQPSPATASRPASSPGTLPV